MGWAQSKRMAFMHALEIFEYFEVDGVEANPTVETLNRAVFITKAERIGHLLAVGAAL